MEEASNLLKRDIVFAASLYIEEWKKYSINNLDSTISVLNIEKRHFLHRLIDPSDTTYSVSKILPSFLLAHFLFFLRKPH
jgi:capsular polysaccharide biosynthesis protein